MKQKTQPKDDFEQQILSNPRDLMIWIKYMAATQDLKGFQSAYDLGKRALLAFETGSNLTDLHKAIINLCFYFGTEAVVNEAFAQAVQVCSSADICIHMTTLYKNKGNWVSAELYMQKLLKKRAQSQAAWSEYISFLYEWRQATSQADEGAALDSKITKISKQALQSLPASKKIMFLTKRAVAEYRVGEFEKARTTFELLISKTPNRADLWNLYVDMELKYGKDDEVKSNLLKRVCELRLKPKSMKLLLTKRLQFEKTVNGAKPKNLEIIAGKYAEYYLQRAKDRKQEQSDAGPTQQGYNRSSRYGDANNTNNNEDRV
jgi:rRNA biogenesis protein RRP5